MFAVQRMGKHPMFELNVSVVRGNNQEDWGYQAKAGNMDQVDKENKDEPTVNSQEMGLKIQEQEHGNDWGTRNILRTGNQEQYEMRL